MKYDIILCGVGGQGIVSLAAIITSSAAYEGMYIKQVEVHGMAQRGGMVVSHLRLSDHEIASEQIPLGTADMILSTEPLESLRSIHFLSSKKGILITSHTPVKNFSSYPDIDGILRQIQNLPRSHIVDAETLARSAGSYHTVNMIVLGVASAYLPIKTETLRERITEKFKGKNNTYSEMNIHAFNLGRETIGGDKKKDVSSIEPSSNFPV